MTDVPPYEVLLSVEASHVYGDIKSKEDLNRVNRILEVLDTVPHISHCYDPVYHAARPPFDVLVVYAGHYGIYYGVKEEIKKVHVYFIEDQRRDPLKRFMRD